MVNSSTCELVRSSTEPAGTRGSEPMPLDVRREPEAENRLEQRVSRPGDALLYGSGMMGGAVLIVSGVCFLTQPYLIRGWQQYLAGAALTAYGAGFAYVAHWMHKERQR